MKKVIISRIIIGFIVGVFVGILISLLSSSFNYILSPAIIESCGNVFGFIVQAIFTGIIGVAGIGGMSFYDTDLLDSYGLHIVTFIHYLCVVIAFIISAVILGWGAFIHILIMTIIETFAFFTIWFIMYIRWKKEIKDMNENLEKYKENN